MVPVAMIGKLIGKLIGNGAVNAIVSGGDPVITFELVTYIAAPARV